ncbi:MAG: glycosyltransferase family 4 protein [Symploca sp. SIO2D2]|nr:glycosyltransferase family 4 protein [Symploca sp. SIO2D2]
MKRIAFHLPNRNIPSADLSNPESGNPGIGGTHFLFAALPYYLNKYFFNVIECRIHAELPDRLPPNIKIEHTPTIDDAFAEAEKSDCDIFVFRPEEITLSVFERFKNTRLNLVAWEHNLEYPHGAALAQLEALKLFVCVSSQHLKVFEGNPIYEKSCFILNFLDAQSLNPREFVETAPHVAYVGSIIPIKGLHILAEIWKYIIEKVPEAKLDIIGNGQVYKENAELGKWGLCDEKYESLIRKHLAGPDGSPHPSVRLHGKLGTDKIQILQKARVGIPNPSALSECCPGSALEMQACGTPVVTLDKNGFKDTVAHQVSGYLCKDHTDVINYTAALLQDANSSYLMGQKGIDFVNAHFNPYLISYQWLRLFNSIC